MEDQFVTYEQALALKELGFDKPCFGAYRSHSHFIGHLDIQYCTTNNLKQYEWLLHTLAPLKSQVFKWFRDTYKIQGYIKSYTIRGGNGSQNFCDYIYVINGIGMKVIQTDARDGQFKTYEEAESACIDKLIEIIKTC